MSVGGFTVFKSAERWRVHFDARKCLFGGFVIPTATKDNLRTAPYVWLVAGGPIASVLLVAASAFALFRCGGGSWHWLGSLFWGALIPLISLIPMRAGENLSDMARLWQFLRRPERFRRWIAFLVLQTKEANGILPRDWDPEVSALGLEIDPSEAHYSAAQMFAYYRSVDLGEGGAAQHLENALAAGSRRGSEKLRQWCYLDAASECARSRDNAAHARIWLERARKLDRPESVAHIEAEIAMCEGRYSEALRGWDDVRKFIERKRSATGFTRFVLEQVAKSESECHAAIAEAADTPTPVRPRGSPALPQAEEPQPFPWISVAAIVSVVILILLAATLGYFGR